MRLIHEMTYRERIDGPWGPTTNSPLGERLCWAVPEATIRGARVDLHLVMPGADWIRLGPDGIRRPDQRLTFTDNDGAIVLLRYRVAIIRETPAFLEALRNGTATTFDEQYIRMAPEFETGEPSLSWLTSAMWLAEGRVAGPRQIEYRVDRVD